MQNADSTQEGLVCASNHIQSRNGDDAPPVMRAFFALFALNVESQLIR